MFQVFILLCGLGLTDAEFLTVEPWDIQAGAGHFPANLSQIASVGSSIFLRDSQSPRITEFSVDGYWVRNIGGRGQGPGEFGFLGPSSIAAEGEFLWVFHGNYLSLFRDGTFEKSHNLGRTFPQAHSYTSNCMGLFSDKLFLTRQEKTKKWIGLQVQWQGKEPVFSKFTEWTTEDIQGPTKAGSVAWAADADGVYQLFLFQPKIRAFTTSLNLRNNFSISGPEIAMCEANLNKFDPTKHPPPLPHFSDFQAFGPHLFVMCRNALYQIDKESGRVQRIIYFQIRGRSLEASEEFSAKFVNPSSYALFSIMRPAIYFPFFRILDNGALMLANVVETSDYSLWRVPDFIPPKSTGQSHP